MHPKIETITAPIDNTPARQNSVSHGKEILRRLVKEKGLDDAPDMTDEMMDDVVNWVEKYTTQIRAGKTILRDQPGTSDQLTEIQEEPSLECSEQKDQGKAQYF